MCLRKRAAWGARGLLQLDIGDVEFFADFADEFIRNFRMSWNGFHGPVDGTRPKGMLTPFAGIHIGAVSEQSLALHATLTIADDISGRRRADPPKSK